MTKYLPILASVWLENLTWYRYEQQKTDRNSHAGGVRID